MNNMTSIADASDRDLGMHRRITRRDFINGVAIPVGGALVLPRWASALGQPPAPEQAPDYYPPTETGMRGSHDGSWEVGHQMRDQRGWDLSGARDTGEHYDLVIVGGGISGLAAAHFFITHVGREARVLVLDNHDDFGGHAKRNEFHYNGRMLALNGGTLNIESPERYNAPSRALLNAIGIDLDRFRSNNAESRGLYRR
ncbi:MAG TPA: NAD(P)/FAD-dependent oxidoreductase, partial [Acidobacteria bacterium]|nr:NAD(P)/FAD-dependent oxidoreductase [Acidobacteriota bacterium]